MKQIFSFLTAMLAVTICHSQANTKLSNLVSPAAVNVSLLSGGPMAQKIWVPIQSNGRTLIFMELSSPPVRKIVRPSLVITALVVMVFLAAVRA